MSTDSAAAAFRSLTPEVQQSIVRQMVGRTPNPRAFSDTLALTQSADNVAARAMQIYNMMQSNEGAANPSVNEIVQQSLPPEEQSVTQSPIQPPPIAPPTAPIASPTTPPPLLQAPTEQFDINSGMLPPLNENPVSGEEFAQQDNSATYNGVPPSNSARTVAGIGTLALMARQFELERRKKMPRVVESTLSGGQERGQRDLFSDFVEPNESLPKGQVDVDPRQADMQLGDPRQLELPLEEELKPLKSGAGDTVGYYSEDVNKKLKFYDLEKEFLGTNPEEVKAKYVSTQDPSIPSIPNEPEKKVATKKKGNTRSFFFRKVKVPDEQKQATFKVDDKTLLDNIKSTRRIRAKGAAKFVDKEVKGEMQRVVTEADGSKKYYNKDHKRWRELEFTSGRSKQKVIMDKESGRIYDSGGFQITDESKLKQIKKFLPKGFAAAIKVIF